MKNLILIAVVMLWGIKSIARELNSESVGPAADMPKINCSSESMLSLCTKLNALKGDQTIKFTDNARFPTGDEMKNRADEAKTGVININVDVKRIRQSLFEDTQKLMIEAILQGRKKDQASPAEQNLVDRISKMTLASEKDAAFLQVCKNRGTVAHNMDNNTLIVCPVLSNYPHEGQVHAMAIFMGRSIGRCNTGLDKKTTGFDPIPADQYPFSNSPSVDGHSLVSGGVLQCITKGKVVAVNPGEGEVVVPKNLTSAQAKAFITKALAKFAKANEMKVAALKTEVKNIPSCDIELTHDQSDSAMADWLGAEVLARWIEYKKSSGYGYRMKDHPTAFDGYEPLAFIMDNACRVMNDSKILDANGHPDWKIRFDEVIFKNPRLLNDLHCIQKDSQAKSDTNPADNVCKHSVVYPRPGEYAPQNQNQTSSKTSQSE